MDRAVFLSGLQLQIPDWVDVVKTATFKELPPQDKDWYYIRAGAMLVSLQGSRERKQDPPALAAAAMAVGAACRSNVAGAASTMVICNGRAQQYQRRQQWRLAAA
jgi:hypothetical protein